MKPIREAPVTRVAEIAPSEWQARIELAAAYRIFAYLGWAELIYNHISLRVPGEPEHFLLNPFGLHYSEVCASNLVKVDLAGHPVDADDASPGVLNPAGLTFHAAFHAALADAHCIMHVHTTASMAVCSLEDGLSFSNFYAAQLYGKIAYHAFEGITTRADEGQRMVQSAAGRPILLLRNHGPVTMGFSVANAFAKMWLLNRACEVQLATQSMGQPMRIAPEVLNACARDSLNFDPRFGAGQDAFDALQRLIERIDPSYRH